MHKIWLLLLDSLEKQGLSLLLLAAAIFWLNQRYERIEESLATCNEQVIEYYRADHAEMKRVIDNNTRVIEKLVQK